MNTNTPHREPGSAESTPPPKSAEPDWADGLRKLYDSVIEEPLPDSFRDLLDSLDNNADESGEAE